MIAMLVAAAGNVSAQIVAAEGSRIRVKTADSKSVGTLTEKTEQQLTLRLENGSVIRVPWVNVERLDVSLGKSGNVGKGALIGLGAGVLVGIVVAQNDCEGSSFVFESETECTGFAALAHGVIGLAGGALVGAFVKTERWKEVDTDPQITLALPKRGIGARLQVRW